MALRLLKAGFTDIPKSPLSMGDFKPTFMEPSIMDVRKVRYPQTMCAGRLACDLTELTHNLQDVRR